MMPIKLFLKGGSCNTEEVAMADTQSLMQTWSFYSKIGAWDLLATVKVSSGKRSAALGGAVVNQIAHRQLI